MVFDSRHVQDDLFYEFEYVCNHRADRSVQFSSGKCRRDREQLDPDISKEMALKVQHVLEE